MRIFNGAGPRPEPQPLRCPAKGGRRRQKNRGNSRYGLGLAIRIHNRPVFVTLLMTTVLWTLLSAGLFVGNTRARRF